MASFRSASIFAFFWAFESSAVRLETLLDKTFRDLSFRDMSPLGIMPKVTGSLASRFSPGIVAGVADLILAKTSVGLRDALRLN